MAEVDSKYKAVCGWALFGKADSYFMVSLNKGKGSSKMTLIDSFCDLPNLFESIICMGFKLNDYL